MMRTMVTRLMKRLQRMNPLNLRSRPKKRCAQTIPVKINALWIEDPRTIVPEDHVTKRMVQASIVLRNAVVTANRRIGVHRRNASLWKGIENDEKIESGVHQYEE